MGGAGLLLILAPALLAANGQWADAATDEAFHFAQETVGAEGAAGVGVAADRFLRYFVAGNFLEGVAPLPGRHLGAPGGHVQKTCARIGLTT